MIAEKKIGVVVIMALLGLEGSTRFVETRLSKDLAHVATFEGLGKRLGPAGPHKFRILVLGNSLARHGVNRDKLKVPFTADFSESAVEVAGMVPDSSAIAEWSWGFRRYVEGRGGRPQLVLIFTGPKHLLDRPIKNPERMGAFYVAANDKLDFLLSELSDTNSRCRFLIAGFSRLFADRGRVRPLAFYNLVPGYERIARDINRRRRSQDDEISVSAMKGEEFRHLEALLRSVKATGAEAIIISIPMPEGSYRLPSRVGELADTHGVEVFEIGDSLVFEDEDFPDGYHLGPEGAERFTLRLTEMLKKWWHPHR